MPALDCLIAFVYDINLLYVIIMYVIRIVMPMRIACIDLKPLMTGGIITMSSGEKKMIPIIINQMTRNALDADIAGLLNERFKKVYVLLVALKESLA